MSNSANSFLFSDSTDTGNGHQAAQSCNLQCSSTESFQTDVAYIIVFARTTSKRPNLHLHSISICIIHISILVVPCNWICIIHISLQLDRQQYAPRASSALASSLFRAGKISDGSSLRCNTMLVEQQQPHFAFSLGPRHSGQLGSM